jgi:hypothetical protein
MSELLDANSFGVLMEKTMKEARCTYIEAVLLICEQRGLDVETVPELLSPKLKKRLRNEASNLNLMKKKAKS